MPITSLPQFNPASAYQPVVYTSQFSIAAPESIAYVQYEIFYNGQSIAIDTKSPDSIVGTTYFFVIDISAFLQRALAPNKDKSSMFGNLAGLFVGTNLDAFGDINIVVKYAVQDEFGIIGDPTFTENTLVQQASIAKRQNGELRSLDQLINPQIKFLTKRPEFKTAPGCSSFLSFYNNQPTMNGVRVIAIDSSGAVINTHYSTFGTYQSLEQMTVGVGYENIDESDATDWLNGDDKPILSAAASYFVDFGEVTADVSGIVSGYTAFTEQVLYEVDNVCSKKLKLLWLNDLGGVDDYYLPFVALSAVVGSDTFEKPLAWNAGSATPHAQYDYGRLRNNITAGRKYAVETRVAPNIAKWIRGLLTSAEIYLINPENGSELFRVFPDPNNYVEAVGFGLVSIGFDLSLSQDYVVHRV